MEDMAMRTFDPASLAVDLNTAKDLDLNIPPTLFAHADNVTE